MKCGRGFGEGEEEKRAGVEKYGKRVVTAGSVKRKSDGNSTLMGRQQGEKNLAGLESSRGMITCDVLRCVFFQKWCKAVVAGRQERIRGERWERTKRQREREKER